MNVLLAGYHDLISLQQLVAAIFNVANLTVIGLYFSLETMIFAFQGKFLIRRECLHFLLMMSAWTELQAFFRKWCIMDFLIIMLLSYRPIIFM